MEQAIKLSQGGRLIGKGCEAHEAKDQARRDRKATKRKAKVQVKAEVQAALAPKKVDTETSPTQPIEKKRKEREGSPATMSAEGLPISSSLTHSNATRPEEKKVKIDAVAM